MFRKDERGLAATELALVLPLLLLILFGIIEGGRIFSAWLEITNDAREGARYGAVRAGDPAATPTLLADVRSYVTKKAAGLVDTDPSKFSVIVQQLNTGTPDASFSVAVSYTMDIYMPLVQQLLPNPLHLYAKSVMRAE
ncbi:MAG: pilus assembly protein [Chloroflexota bacterium]|nr:MAG: pilus assembly protein [Chloroflexota bacterium]